MNHLFILCVFYLYNTLQCNFKPATYSYGFEMQTPADKKLDQQNWIKETTRALSQSTMNGRVEHPEYIINNVYEISTKLFQNKQEGLYYKNIFINYSELNNEEIIIFDSLKILFYEKK